MSEVDGRSCIDEIGSWSEYIKHDILRRYLPARRAILHQRRQWFPGGDHYVDGFAGAGMARLRNEDRLVKGSPRIALELLRPFDRYWFIEQTSWRVERLREMRAEYPDHAMTVLEGDCNQLIVERVVPVVRAAYRARGFALLDPYTMNLDWATIEAIARTNAFEILVNLPTMAFNRGVLHNNTGTVAPKQVERLTRAWGSDEWLDDLYEERQGLWESRRVKLGPTGAARLGRMFKERLAREFPFVSEPLVVPNTAGTPIYCLIFAGPNETGWKIASDVFRKPIQLPELLPLPSPQMMTLPFGDAV